MKKSFLFFLGIAALFGIVRIYYALTDDFHTRNISFPMPYRPEWDFPLSKAEQENLKKIMGQKFYYLGKGAQVYAFGSEDGQYVIKFFKFKHLRPSLLIELIPPLGPLKKFKEDNIKRKLRKREGVFAGHALAYVHDKLYSGLLYLHFNPTDHLDLKVEVVDKIGRSHFINLDPTVFVVQKRGITLRESFQKDFERKDVASAASKGARILDMYVAEYQQGVYDRDHGISHNTGFIGDLPFHLDVGKFAPVESSLPLDFFLHDLSHVADKLKEWVHKNYPEQFPEFEKLINEHLERSLTQLKQEWHAYINNKSLLPISISSTLPQMRRAA